MDHGTFRQLAAGAAIDDLDPTERLAFDAHVRSCVACAGLARDLDDVVGELALASPTVTPPFALRRTVMTAVRDADGPSTRPGARPSASPPWRLGAFAGFGLAAALAVVSVGLGVRLVALDADVAAARVASSERAAAMAVMADPSHLTASLTAEPVAPVANAIVIYRPGSTDAFVLADRLPATPDGMVYQLWFADAAGVHALGTFHYDGAGPFLAPFGVDLATGAAAMVTLEPEGGAVGDPGPQVVFGEL